MKVAYNLRIATSMRADCAVLGHPSAKSAYMFDATYLHTRPTTSGSPKIRSF